MSGAPSRPDPDRAGPARRLLARLRELGICDFVDDPPPSFTFHEMRVEQYRRVTVLGTPVQHERGWRLTAGPGVAQAVSFGEAYPAMRSAVRW